mgnify:CR=1 FL=1
MKKFVMLYTLILSILIIVFTTSDIINSIISSMYNVPMGGNAEIATPHKPYLGLYTFLPGILYILVGIIGIFAVIKNKSKVYLLSIGWAAIIIFIIGFLSTPLHYKLPISFWALMGQLFDISSGTSILLHLIVGIPSLIIGYRTK